MKNTLIIILMGTLLASCSDNHLVADKNYLSTIESSFKERLILADNRKDELFSVFNNDLTKSQTEALEFLFAFMPLSDLADYNGEFFLENVNLALRARDETAWGKYIPENIFLHYVLPCRVNNENLDSFRIKYYEEILQRIDGLQLPEAALEINHWCHEKVAYQPADIRTSAPISSILSARGRCGEESTFTVAALRTAGIPARQVYTPRWAHSDDNHAWVEIWNEGKWLYMGACEPEPVLDFGWFTEPARRAMLVHTLSFGAPYGAENAIISTKYFTEVNNLSKYANTKTIYVKVVDSEGLPVKDASVEYQLYNYAEFYTLATVPSDDNGISQFETGFGDLVVWAHKKNEFDYRKISVASTDTLILNLDRDASRQYSEIMDLNVPVTPTPLETPSNELVEINTARLNRENALRQAYIDSWMTPEMAAALAHKINVDEGRIKLIISRSMGNYKEISSFLLNSHDSLKKKAVALLELLPDKDLRDTKEGILLDHILYSPSLNDPAKNDDYINYILNPRIANEIIVAWRSFFKKTLPDELIIQASSDPSVFTGFLDENVNIFDDENYYQTPITPIGVAQLKVADTKSRSICFVAMCRSIGIPSRLEPGSNIPQYMKNKKWHEVYFSDQIKPEKSKGFIKLVSSDIDPVPEYYIHFTLARFDQGRYNTLEYDYNKRITDFKEELALAPGSYMLVTGNRIDDTKILSETSFFILSENEHKIIDVKLRKPVSRLKLSGSFDLLSIAPMFSSKLTIQEDIIKKGAVILWLEPEKEPSIHILNDLLKLRTEFEKWNGYFLFFLKSDYSGKSFSPEMLNTLPRNSLFAVDSLDNALRINASINTLSDVSLPFVILSAGNGDILFTSSGYTIGIGEQILKHIAY